MEDLPEAIGLHELNLVLSLERDTNDTAKAWVQRLSIGRQCVQQRMGTNLSDAVYVELAMRQFLDGENMDLVSHVHVECNLHATYMQDFSPTDVKMINISEIYFACNSHENFRMRKSKKFRMHNAYRSHEDFKIFRMRDACKLHSHCMRIFFYRNFTCKVQTTQTCLPKWSNHHPILASMFVYFRRSIWINLIMQVQ